MPIFKKQKDHASVSLKQVDKKMRASHSYYGKLDRQELDTCFQALIETDTSETVDQALALYGKGVAKFVSIMKKPAARGQLCEPMCCEICIDLACIADQIRTNFD